MKKIRIVGGDHGFNYGILGTDAKFKGLKIGDIIAYYYQEKVRKGVILYNDDAKEGRIMGRFSEPLIRLLTDFKVIVPSSLVTPELINNITGDDEEQYFRFTEPKKLTVKEIEDLLGYSIEIVEEF